MRRTTCHIASIPRLIVGIFALLFVEGMLIPASSAETPEQTDSSKTARIQRQAAGLEALSHLREGHLEFAMKSLDAAADSNLPISFIEDDFLSAACAGLNRSLSQLGDEAQFDLLRKWSITAGSTAKIRHLVALVPIVGPPAEFARVLGERPQQNSFPISAIGAVRGISSTAWSLVIAARQSGRLTRLMTDLEPLVDQKISGADLLMLLAKIADERSDVAKVADQLDRLTTQITDTVSVAGTKPTIIDPGNVVVAVAALNRTVLRPHVEKLLAALLGSIQGQPNPYRCFLRQAQTTACFLTQTNRSEADVASALACRLKYWVPVSEGFEETNSRGFENAFWLTHEDHILHVSGSPLDVLLLRFPLTGDFQFQCEAQLGGRFETDGSLLYGGLHYRVAGHTGECRVNDVSGEELGIRHSPFAHRPNRLEFTRLSIESTPKSVTADVAQHPIWVDRDSSRSSPWLGLTSDGECRPLFRNLKLTGQPLIPRFVRLSDQLRGWKPRVYGRHELPQSKTEPDWNIAEGEIRSTTQAQNDSQIQTEQKLLSYERPLLGGDKIDYEFFYEQGTSEVSPALGRVAFVLQPDGVRLHWLTDGDKEWTTLPGDNSLVEPLCRQGPRPLPFRANDWNRLTFQRKDQIVTVSLNDVAIYERPIDWRGDHKFGLYRHNPAATVRARNVILTGDWPETLPTDFLENPAAIEEPSSSGDQVALNTIFREDNLAANVLAIRRKAQAMPIAERFQFLSGWMLPGMHHPGFRIVGAFTPTRPAPGAVEPGVEGSETGAQVVSPVFDWVDAAKQLGQLAECRESVEHIAATDNEFQQRARASLLILLDLESGTSATHEDAWQTLFGLLNQQVPAEEENHWPEMLIAARGSSQFPDHPLCNDLITELAVQRMLRWRQHDAVRWQTHLAAIYGRALSRRSTDSDTSPAKLRDWIPASSSRAASNGAGFPNPVWNRQDNHVVKISGHDTDFLFYRLPLKGDFQIECDLIQPFVNPVGILAAGSYAGPIPSLDGLEIGTIRAAAPNVLFQPKLTNVGSPFHYRAVIHQGTRDVYLNARKVLSDSLTAQFDPWIGIRSSGRYRSNVQNLRVAGNPVVLESVPLSVSSELTGWLNYHEEGQWAFVDQPESGGWIVDRLNTSNAGTCAESLLRYQRPLVEDGSIEYEFFYDPAVIESHPAVDRLALILDPSGVREHWITHGRHERTESAPDKLADLPSNRRGPPQLPLLSGKWNRLLMTFRGQNVSLKLNGTLVYERILESSNQRAFGLFHYVDKTEARVRNVVMRGDWPKTLPRVSDQELAGQTMEWLDADLPRLKSVFYHDCIKDGLPERYFEFPVLDGIAAIPAGVQVTQSTSSTAVVWDICARFKVSGDFDLETTFADLEIAKRTQHCGVLMRIVVEDPERSVYDVHRNVNHIDQRLVQSGMWLSEPKVRGRNEARSEVIACEAESGRFRLARRGNKLYYLFAEGNSSLFNLIATDECSSADTLPNGVRFECYTFGADLKVVWKNFTLRAERMTWFPGPPKNNLSQLKIVQADGSGTKSIASPSSVGFRYMGSPEWSADGKKLAVDMSGGSVPTSHIGVMNSDGSELRDLGPGSMPSFSADGKMITFSLGGGGIMTMKSDGTDRQTVDPLGWGTQWSPDGKWIAYGKRGNITLLDVATRKSRQLLAGDASTRYAQIYWNLAWSHDSRSIGFKARSRTTFLDELAVIEIDSPNGLKVLQLDAAKTHPDITFSPDNASVIAGIELGNATGHKLFAINRKHPETRKLLEAIPPGSIIDGAAWSHDGKRIAIIALEVTQPTEWVEGMKEE